MSPGLRESRKAETRRNIQEHAIRLFLAQGYETTTVQQIADAAGVSHMTFFRNFPAKEDVVEADDYDPMIAELIRARPADEHVVDRVRHALADGLAKIYAADHETLLERSRLVLSAPALRARLWEGQAATRALIAGALGDCDSLRSRVVAAACVSAVTTAVEQWVEDEGRAELPELIDEAFLALREELG